jgi:hypothetical protein
MVFYPQFTAQPTLKREAFNPDSVVLVANPRLKTLTNHD